MTIFKFFPHANGMLQMKLSFQVGHQRQPLYLTKPLSNLPIPSDKGSLQSKNKCFGSWVVVLGKSLAKFTRLFRVF